MKIFRIAFVPLLLLELSFFSVSGQFKKPIDLDAINKWSFVDRPGISQDGRFAIYLIQNKPFSYSTLVLCSTENAWKMEIVSKNFNYMDYCFTEDGQYCIFRPGDSLAFSTLGTDKLKYIPHVSGFKVINRRIPLLVYETNNSNDAIVYDLNNERKLVTVNSRRYAFDHEGKYLVCEVLNKNSDSTGHRVDLYNLADQSRQTIWEGVEAKDFKFDTGGDQLVFISKNSSSSDMNLMHYRMGDKHARVLSRNEDIPIDGKFSLTSISGFNQDGSILYFEATQNNSDIPSPLKASVDIWSFNDSKLQSDESNNPNNKFYFGVRPGNNKLFAVCNSYGVKNWNPSDPNFSDQFVLRVNSAGGASDESFWNKQGEDSVSVISTTGGHNKLIDFNLTSTLSKTYQLSSNGEYVIYFDGKQNNYFSYCLKTGERINITKGMLEQWTIGKFRIQNQRHPYPKGIAAWIRNTNDVLIYGRYDIWRVSLDGRNKPVCITKRFGQLHHIEFFFQNSFSRVFIDEGELVYLSVLDSATKKNGFFSADITGRGNLKELILDDHAYYVPGCSHGEGLIFPIKAENTNAWLVVRQRYNESMNYYFTKDFHTFKPLSYNYPEKEYNWMRADLISWKLPDGSTSQGILYKPEDLNPDKKYPVIFNYYEEVSNNLNIFLKPENAVADINIPYYVSNGYLVFTPDIKPTKKGAGQDALNTMESAAMHLSKISYVNANKLGICGTSMGGYKTEFILTHSRLFAAANANAGISNVSALAMDIWGNPGIGGNSMDRLTTLGQYYLGHSLTERPDLYIKSSPIFYIKDVRTPLLMMHNKNDGACPWVQGLTMFNALRRLGKPVWMMQYDGHAHFLASSDTLATTDWTKRQKQFFDHYLMDKPAPVWMTRGVSPWKKRIEDGMELDAEITTPVTRLLSQEEYKRREDNKKNKPLTFVLD